MSSLIEDMVFPSSAPSFEADSHEYEIEFYLENFDLEQVRSMASSHEGQEQWGTFVPKCAENDSSASIRVRRTIHPDGKETFVFCTKTEGGEKGKVEVEEASTAEQLNQFRRFCTQGLVKTRYNIPGQLKDGTDVLWEVDVFMNSKGKVVPWAKIDLELEAQRPQGIEVSDIPFNHDSLIMVTPEQKANGNPNAEKIAKLYETYFRTSNVYVE